MDIFGYIRGGNVPAPKNEGKTMNRTTWNTTFERADVAKIPTKKILIVFAVWNNETRKFSYDYTVKEFEIYYEETDLKKLCENVVAFKEGYINGKIGKELYKFELNNFYEIEHVEA